MHLPESTSDEPRPGTLYVVSTPIGNLEDITVRALRILERVHLIAAEDTRTTRFLLDHYGITNSLTPLFSHNETRKAPELVERLRQGDSLAVVSDAGTPGLSDPAALLISSVAQAGLPVVAVPGASALLAGLVSSGFRIDRFWFEGFLPIKKRRQTRIRELATMQRTVVLYESVHRLLKTLTELRDALGADIRVAVGRELTKKFEEILRGTLAEAVDHFTRHTPRGEFVIIIDGAGSDKRDGTDQDSRLLN